MSYTPSRPRCWADAVCAAGRGPFWGVIIGAAVLRVLRNAIIFLHIPTHLEFAIIGAVILAGVIVDELVKRVAASRREARERGGG